VGIAPCDVGAVAVASAASGEVVVGIAPCDVGAVAVASAASGEVVVGVAPGGGELKEWCTWLDMFEALVRASKSRPEAAAAATEGVCFRPSLTSDLLPECRSSSFASPEREALYSLVCRSVFGHDSFRGRQKPCIAAAAEGRDVFAVFPTGRGKSLCFQLPAVVQVVSLWSSPHC